MLINELSKGKVLRERHFTRGNQALLVLVDSSGPFHNRRIVDETVLVALEHYGLPYRPVDLARQRLSAELLAGCAGLVIAQSGVSERLTAGEGQLIVGAVGDGMGLVNFDSDIRHCPASLWSIFGFQGVDRLPIASDTFFLTANPHYITGLQKPQTFHKSGRMVTALVVDEWGCETVPLVEAVLGKDQLVYMRHLVPGNAFEPKHYPVVFAACFGRGRAVQYTVNPRLWRNSAMGHLGGLGDVFWRSLVWTARKPFLANMIPPYVALSFDDCSGRHDFRYLDICTRHGFKPMASLFLNKIREHQRDLLRSGVEAGEISVNSHALDYYRLAYYDFGVEEYSQEEMAASFARQDEFFRWLGVSPCRTVRSHWGEHGVRALPFHKERGQTFICVPIHIGEHKADQFRTDPGEGYWPYDTVNCFYDYLPDDPDFYIFGSFAVRHLADFLTGATILLQESPFNNLEKAADQGALHLTRGLNNGFYSELVTHEHKFSVLSLEEWDRILAGTLSRLDRHEKIFAGHDEIACSLRAKDACWIEQVDCVDGKIQGVINGNADVDLQLSLFTGADDGVERTYLRAPSFSGSTRVEG